MAFKWQDIALVDSNQCFLCKRLLRIEFIKLFLKINFWFFHSHQVLVIFRKILKGGDSLSYLPQTTVTREAVKSMSSRSLVSLSLIKSKGFIINRFI